MVFLHRIVRLLHRLKVRHRLGYCRVWCQSLLIPPPPGGRFPPVCLAAKRPWGLLSVGGVMTPDTLLEAYSRGIYSFYDEHPVKWFSCNPRMVLYPERMRIEKGWRKLARGGRYRVTFDTVYEEVVRRCSERKWTWLIPERIEVAIELHRRGRAHSVEVWDREGRLVGGKIGVDMGRLYIGESSFSIEKNVIHVANIHLVCHLQHWGYALLDAQAYGKHLHMEGYEEIPRKEYIRMLPDLVDIHVNTGPWKADENLDVGAWNPALPGSQLKAANNRENAN